MSGTTDESSLANPTASTAIALIQKFGLSTFLLIALSYLVVLPMKDALIENWKENAAASREMAATLRDVRVQLKAIEDRTVRIDFLLTKDPKVWSFSSP